MNQKQLFQCYSPLQSYSLGHWNWWQWLQLRCQSYTRGNRMGLPLLSFFVKMGLPPLGITTRSKHHKSSCDWTRPYYIPSFQIGGTLSPSSPMYKTLWVNHYGGDLESRPQQLAIKENVVPVVMVARVPFKGEPSPYRVDFDIATAIGFVDLQMRWCILGHDL